MAITVQDISELRTKTGAGMMECKKVLTETNGNIEEAIKLLKERGLAVAAKKADRIAAEGLVDILYDEASKTAAMLEVNIETDFAAKSEAFIEFVRDCVKVIMKERPKDIDELLTKPFNSEVSVDAALKEKTHIIGEKISLRRFVITEGLLNTYNHGKGKIGVIIKLDADEKIIADSGFEEFRKNIALQVASMNPGYVDKEDVPVSAIEAEKERISEEMKEDESNAKKPANVIEKMMEGKIRKYYDNACLLLQEYVKSEDKSNVAAYIENYKKQVGGEVKVAEFYRYEKGVGIEKREDDFAEEIAQLTRKA